MISLVISPHVFLFKHNAIVVQYLLYIFGWTRYLRPEDIDGYCFPSKVKLRQPVVLTSTENLKIFSYCIQISKKLLIYRTETDKLISEMHELEKHTQQICYW